MLDDHIDIEEKINIIDHFSQQLVNSGYSKDKIREIICSGLKGIMRKERERKERNSRYRGAHETLGDRLNKKLLEATTWYKEGGGEERIMDEIKENKYKEGAWKGWRVRMRKRKREDSHEDVLEKKKMQGVIFVPHTMHSELASRMREKLREFEKVSNFKVKLVEKTGEKIEDILHKSNPWDSNDCERLDCLLCNSAGEKRRKGQCKKRSVVYETYCINCEEEETSDDREKELYIQEERGEGEAVISNKKGKCSPGDGEKELHSQEEKKERKAVKSTNDGQSVSLRAGETELQTPEERLFKEIVKSTEDVIDLSPGEEEKELPSQEDGNNGKAVKRKIDVIDSKVGEKKRDGDFRFKYIGETNRSAYERGKEHLRDLKDMNEGSHFLKHYLRHHRNIKLEEMKVGMRIRAQYRSDLERQIGEAISILMDQKKVSAS